MRVLKIASRKCPICECENKRELFHQQFAKIQQTTFMISYKVVQCCNCGFVFADNIPEQEYFNVYYEESSKYDNLSTEIKNDRKKLFENKIAFLGNIIGDSLYKSKLIDIGCSLGDFLRVLKDNGCKNVFGMDPSTKACDILNHEFKIKCINATFDTLKTDDKFDIITMIGVLEHVQDIKNMFNCINGIVNKSGYLFISVPDMDSVDLETCQPFQEFSSEHINFFTHRSLVNLLSSYGWELVAKKPTQVSDGVAIDAVFMYTGDRKDKFIKCDASHIDNYIKACLIKEKVKLDEIKEISHEEDNIIVWGIGTYTQRLLALGAFSNVNIVALVDRNPRYHGGDMNGVPVIAPEAIYDFSEPIYISTFIHNEEIAKYIKESLKLKNKICNRLSSGGSY